jgi:hypothetical protein
MGHEGFLPLSHLPKRRLVGFEPLPIWLAPKVLTIELRAEPLKEVLVLRILRETTFMLVIFVIILK